MKTGMQKKVLYLEAALYMLFLYGTTACVFLNGDDFMYGSFSKLGIMDSVASYYVTGNGRIWINILDSLLLSFDRYLFIAVTPLIVMAFLFLLAKNVQWIAEGRPDNQKEREYLRYAMVLFACLDVLCLRETVFWITGMMNYLFPAVIFLFAVLWLQRLRSDCNVPMFKKALYCLVCLFAGSSVEQFALMFVGLETLLLGADLLHKKSASKLLAAGYLCSLIGLAILLLAPGNFVRVDTQNELMPAFIDNIWTLVYQNTMSHVAFPYLLMLSVCASFYLFHNCQSKWIQTVSFAIPILMVAIRCIPIIEKAVLITGLLALFLLEMIYFFIKQTHTGKWTIFSFLLVGLGSQIMLLISAIWGFRCMFSMYMIYMLLILFYMFRLDRDLRVFVLCSGIVASLSPVAVVVFWCLCALVKNRKSLLKTICNVSVRASVIIAMAVLLSGYAGNVTTHMENLEKTAQASASGELELRELPDDTYSWYFIPIGEFHENYYRIYHSIPDSVVISYETVDEVQ